MAQVFTLAEIEDALDTGYLWAAVNRGIDGEGRYWKARRNGKTKRWKRDTTRFEIPFKTGFRVTGTVANTSIIGFEWGADYIISVTQPVKGETRFVREMKAVSC